MAPKEDTDTIAPLAVLRGLFRYNCVSKTRRVSRDRLKGIFDEAKLKTLLEELSAEDDELEKKRVREAEDHARIRFTDAVPEGDLVLTDFDFFTEGGLEEDLCQYYRGSRFDLDSEFDVEFRMESSASGTFNGEPFEVSIEIDMHHEMDEDNTKVWFEPECSLKKAEFPLIFKDAALALCQTLPKLARDELESEIESEAEWLERTKE